MANLETIQFKDQVEVLIPELMLKKIRKTCQVIHKVEWSGVLIYLVAGSVRDLSTFKITLLDIHLMDKGTQGFTSYDTDESVADAWMEAIMEHGDRVRLGHIHSHNNMEVFFSGTDMDELYDNCENHNLYLSIIVNNATDIIGKLVYRGMSSGDFKCKDEDGEEYTIQGMNQRSVLFAHNCRILLETPIIEVDDKYMERLKYIDTKVKYVAPVQQKVYTPQPQQTNQGNGLAKKIEEKKTPLLNQTNSYSSWEQGLGNNIHSEKQTGGGNITDKTVQFFKDEDLLGRSIDDSEDFAAYLLRFGVEFPDDTIEAACEVLAEEKAPIEIVIKNIIGNYGMYYEKFFSDSNVDEDSLDDFLDIISDVANFYEEIELKYYFLPQLVLDLRQFALEVETKWKSVVFNRFMMTEPTV